MVFIWQSAINLLQDMMFGKKKQPVKKEILNDFDFGKYLQFYNDGNINMF